MTETRKFSDHENTPTFGVLRMSEDGENSINCVHPSHPAGPHPIGENCYYYPSTEEEYKTLKEEGSKKSDTIH